MTEEVVKTGHPKGLYTLFATEMWERFSYYGMRALLVLYLTATWDDHGFGLERADALAIYGIFTGLVYLTPVLGGLLADKVLGQRKAILIGGALMALGQFTLAVSAAGTMDERRFFLNMGLGLLILGNGFFKPNISTIVGSLYEEKDPRRDSAFTIFYMGINLGAFFSPLVCGTLGQTVGWSYGFGSAAIGMVLGMVIFLMLGKTLNDVGFPPNRTGNGDMRLTTRAWLEMLGIVVGSGLLVLAFLNTWSHLSETVRNIITWGGFLLMGGGFMTMVALNTKGSDQWSRVGVIFILAIFTIFFWSGFEQAGGTFNLFANENTNLNLFGKENFIQASWFQSVNAIMIFALAPVFSSMWLFLGRIGKNPNTPAKFGIGLVLLGLGFVVMSTANGFALAGDKVSPMWLISVYFLHTLGELCLSPIGLSMVTKLSPPKIVSLMMGFWFGCTALANYLAAVLESILHKFDLPLFPFLACQGIVSGILLLIASPWLKKMMRGIE
ncbi:MAG TPA: peptide MFS transporter [Candidatus Melainabacteria bacterium]|nr:peptide MFS transporter [Candidatus Melainabacteria bacterium]